ncbi:MAG: CotH kinase family protein [Lachnospiraceae bacterium]|nr:CotH kinase family protein [Lachnospiraceae bacterium]
MKSFKHRTIFIICCILFFLATGSVTTFAEETTADPAAPVFSVEAGFYDDTQSLALTAPDGYTIYFTLDGSLPVPGASSTKQYQNPLVLADARGGSSVTKGTVVRAISVSPSGETSTVITKTYFVGAKMTTRYYIPVISLVTDPDNLYNQETGIFVNYEGRGDEWERPMHFEYFAANGDLAVAMDCGTRVHGGASRTADTKSLRLYARKEYGAQKKFVYDFFSNGLVPATDINGEPITEFKRLLLRGGGNEATAWERTYFRDTLSAWLMQDTGLDIQASTPCIVFLNGKYYGIMNLRERQDQRYIEEHYDLKSEEIAIYEFWYDEQGNLNVSADAETWELVEQAQNEYMEIYQFATTSDLSIDANYEKVCGFFDIDNLIDYYCIELYSNNTDWPGNNCKMWRYMGTDTGAIGSDGKARFLLYDTEFGYGLYGEFANYNAVADVLNEYATEWPNQHGSTALFRSLLKNPTFFTKFLTRMCDLINETYESTAACKEVDVMAARYAGFIKENKNAGNQYSDYSDNVNIVKTFLRDRPDYMYLHLSEAFDTGNEFTFHVLFDASMGEMEINSLHITGDSNSYNKEDGGFEGIYFSNCSLDVKAIAKDGYRFTGFTGEITTDEAHISADNSAGKPIFVLEASFEALPVTPTPAPTEVPEAPADSTGDNSTPDNSSTGTTGAGDVPANTSDADNTTNSKYLTTGIVLLTAIATIILLLVINKRQNKK